MLVGFVLIPNMTKPPSFRLEASGGTIAIWRRYVRQRGKIKKRDRVKSKAGRKGRRKIFYNTQIKVKNGTIAMWY